MFKYWFVSGRPFCESVRYPVLFDFFSALSLFFSFPCHIFKISYVCSCTELFLSFFFFFFCVTASADRLAESCHFLLLIDGRCVRAWVTNRDLTKTRLAITSLSFEPERERFLMYIEQSSCTRNLTRQTNSLCAMDSILISRLTWPCVILNF